MSCRVRHRWKQTNKNRVGGFWHYSYACRGCAATRTEYHRAGIPRDEEGGKLVFSILQAFVMSVMLWLLIGRFLAFCDADFLQDNTYDINVPETPFNPN